MTLIRSENNNKGLNQNYYICLNNNNIEMRRPGTSVGKKLRKKKIKRKNNDGINLIIIIEICKHK